MSTSGIYAHGSRIKVLFVDDDEDTRFAYESVASGEGFDVDLAADGHEAIALASIVVPDVVVLDVRLDPLFDGFEVARRLRGEPTHGRDPDRLRDRGCQRDDAPRGLCERLRWAPLEAVLGRRATQPPAQAWSSRRGPRDSTTHEMSVRASAERTARGPVGTALTAFRVAAEVCAAFRLSVPCRHGWGASAVGLTRADES